MDWDSLWKTADLLNDPEVRAGAGLLFGFYAVVRLIKIVGKISEFKEFPYSKNYGVTVQMLCAMNLSFPTFILALIVKSIRDMPVLFPRLLPYSETYLPIELFLSTVTLLLLTYTFGKMASRATKKEYESSLPTRLGKLARSYKSRGIGPFEVLVLVLLTLTTTLLPCFTARFL